MINVISIVEIVLLMCVFIWIYILYRNDKKHSLKSARIILIILTLTIVVTQFFFHKEYFIKQEQEAIPASIIDTTVPVIRLQGVNEITLPANTKYTEPGYIATDDQDGDITSKVEVTRKKVADRTYEVYYNVSDSAGNKAKTVTRRVLVEVAKEEKQTESQENKDNKNKAGVIYLTFDDGPSLDITPKVLDVLKEENIKATFFILNYGESKEELVKRIVDEGHTIGIHGYSHEYKDIYT